MIIKLNSEKQAKKIKEIPELKNGFYKIINNEVLVITNLKDTLELITKTKKHIVSPFNVEVSLTPWLNVYFDNNFFIQNFSDSLITNFQTILKPQSLKDEKQYQLHITNKSDQLIIELIPKTISETKNELVLDSYLNFLPNLSTGIF